MLVWENLESLEMEGWPSLALQRDPATPLLFHDHLPGGQIFLSRCLSFCLLTRIFLYGFQNFSKCFFLTINKTISNTEEYKV